MVKVVFDKTTKKFIGGSRWDTPTFDPATQVLLEMRDFPKEGERWDDADGTRPETSAERAAERQAADDARVGVRLDGDPVLSALVDVLATENGKTRAQIVAAIKANMR